MKTKILVLTAALIGAVSLSANAEQLVYGPVFRVPAPACAPATVACGRPDWRDAAHSYYHHDFRRDNDHRR